MIEQLSGRIGSAIAGPEDGPKSEGAEMVEFGRKSAADGERTDLLRQIAELQAQLARLTAPAAEGNHRNRNRLSTRFIETLKRPGFYADGGNLYLDFKDPPSKNWVLRYKRDGRARDHGLGPYPLVSLAAAREVAADKLRQLRAGIDPIEARKAERQAAQIERAKAMTFRACAEAYTAAHEASWKNPKHAAQWPSTLATYVYPVFGKLPVAAVDTALVIKAIEPIWADKTETASRVRGRIEAVLDWARTRGYRTGENPARWKGHLDSLLPAKGKIAPVENHPALPYAELPAFMASLGETDDTAAPSISVLALKFAILTAARTGELIGARWDEIDLHERLWTIPGQRMKVGKEHRVPLSAPAMRILEQLKKLPASPFVFQSDKPRRPISNMAMLMTLRRMGRADLTVHGFRSTFSDWCAERTNFPSEVREMALAHRVANAVEAAYRRGDLFEKRRQLMVAWAKLCTDPLPAGGAEIVPLTAAGAP
jgi:integrase